MATKIFAVTNNQTNQVERLVKAETQSQVNKHLQKLFDVKPMSSVELAEHAMKQPLVIEDATGETARTPENGGEAAGKDAAQVGGEPLEPKNAEMAPGV